MYLATFIFVILLAFFSTKYIAKKSSVLGRSNNIKVIDGISLGNNTKLFIVEILNIIYIIYDNNSHAVVIEKYNKDDIANKLGDIKSEKEDISLRIKKLLSKKENTLEKLNKEKKNKDKDH